MASLRHKHLVVSPASKRRFARLAIPLAAATAITGSVVGLTVARSEPAGQAASGQAAVVSAPLRATLHPDASVDARVEPASRSARRVKLTAKPPVKKAKPVRTFQPGPVTDHQYLTAPLNVRTGPGDGYAVLDVLPPGTRVAVTGRTIGAFAEIVRSARSRWVTAIYLADHRPAPEPKPQATPAPRAAQTAPATGGGVLSSAPCASGSSMESGITANAVALHRAVCAHFPQVTTYGGWRADGEHSDGRAIDIMVSDSSLGQSIADWVRANYSPLHVSDVIWAQHIWTVQRSSEGWRSMPDRGSATANHYDHVHVQVY